MGVKKIRFDLVERIDWDDALPIGEDTQSIPSFSDQQLLDLTKTHKDPLVIETARDELFHRRSPYRIANENDNVTCQYGRELVIPFPCEGCQHGPRQCDCRMRDRNTTEVLMAMAEDYLNGKLTSMVECESKFTERRISIAPLLDELKYRGIRVLNITAPEEQVLEEENVGKRIVEDVPDVLDYVLTRKVPVTTNVQGRFVYKNLGVQYPVRNILLTVTWYGHHTDGDKFTEKQRTDREGYFSLDSPDGLILSSMKVDIKAGLLMSDTVVFNVSEIRQKDGKMGDVLLTKNYSHLDGLVEALDNLTFDMETVVENTDIKETPQITIGEGDDMFALSPGSIPANYTYKVLHRLISPQLSGIVRDNLLEELLYILFNPYSTRMALDTPIDIERYKEKMKKDPASLAKMGTLGIGYVLSLQQEWRPTNFSLGTLLYSVALAPGEEQRVVVSERTEAYQVTDSESLTTDLSEEYRSNQQSDTDSIFNRSMREFTEGSTSMKSVTKGSSAGLLTSLFMTGSTSRTTTDSESHNYGSRNQMSSLAESFNESISRSAQKERESTRAGIRMATSEESSSVTSKIISNHNHSHALTMQYWEVVRNYMMNTRISDVKMVCYIPFDLIPFLPTDQDHIISPKKLMTTTVERGLNMKPFFYKRYETALNYFDAINSVIPYKYREGLALMKKYAAYPDWDFQKPSSSNAPRTLDLVVKGGILSYHDIGVTLHLKNRKGSIRGTLKEPVPTETHLARNRFDMINTLEVLRKYREQTLNYTFEVPPHIKDDDYDYISLNLTYPRIATYESYRTPEEIEKGKTDAWGPYTLISESYQSIYSIRLTRRELQNIGGPLIKSVSLKKSGDANELICRTPGALASLFVPSKMEELYSTLSYPLFDERPTMSFEELQKIETTFQHIVENTVRYSQAVWGTLTSEERAMLFERYTLALPKPSGVDIGSEVPLTDCIENTVEGFYGNCMIVPFSLPPAMAYEMKTSTKAIQDALYAYHADTFRAPETLISIPAGGMLGEAVLGGSNASEKIDITRFWNWKDSPIDDAPEIDLKKVPDISLLNGATAPSSLLTVKQALSLGLIDPTAMPDIAAELTKEGAAFKNITNMQAVSDHMTAIANKASEERMNTVSKGAIVAKAAMKAAAAAAGGAAAGAAGGLTGGAAGGGALDSVLSAVTGGGSGGGGLDLGSLFSGFAGGGGSGGGLDLGSILGSLTGGGSTGSTGSIVNTVLGALTGNSGVTSLVSSVLGGLGGLGGSDISSMVGSVLGGFNTDSMGSTIGGLVDSLSGGKTGSAGNMIGTIVDSVVKTIGGGGN